MRHIRALFLVAFAASAAFGQQSKEWTERTHAAQQMDAGESAPDWLVDSESYACGFNPGDWGALAQSKVAFITHCPGNREFFQRCHALGIRCFPYVTFYQGGADSTYEDINLKDHPDFIEVDAKGGLKRTGFWESEDAKNLYTTCPNVKEYQDAMVAWVRKIMELGADGVFIDNLGNRVPCFGPKFGKHQHLYDDQNHAFAMLLKRVREVVRQYQPEGAMLGNSANPMSLPKEYWKYLDAEMLESYICTWVSKDRWFDWKTRWNKAGQDLQPYVKAGKQIQALSYIGHTPYGVREDAFYCYASARLAGFVWNGGRPLSDPETADLYRLRLGKALTDEREENGVHYRVFERGMVAVNPDKEKAAAITLAPPMPTKRLFDIFGGGASAWNPYPGQGYSLDNAVRRTGVHSIVSVLKNATEGGGANQHVELSQTKPVPIIISGWSKAVGVSAPADSNYSLYADLVYDDGTPFHGQIVPFSVGTHDWEFKTLTIHPAKPVRSLTLNALLRNKTGTAWFDDISVREEGGPELARNGGFEEQGQQGRTLDLSTPGRLEVPKYSGRVYLFASDTKDELAVHGPVLNIVTSPAMGEVCFRVDGFDYWTHSGRWATEYILGDMFGRFQIVFDKPGKHVIEIVDVIPNDMKTRKGYSSGERLGQFMDPSMPTQPSGGKKFRFREWGDGGRAAKIEVDVSKDTTVTAKFDVEEVKK